MKRKRHQSESLDEDSDSRYAETSNSLQFAPDEGDINQNGKGRKNNAATGATSKNRGSIASIHKTDRRMKTCDKHSQDRTSKLQHPERNVEGDDGTNRRLRSPEASGLSDSSLASAYEDRPSDKNALASKKGRRGRRQSGRPRESTPTPPRSLPPHEHYFFQNRPGGNRTSDNTLSTVSLPNYEEYFEAMRRYRDPHQAQINFLHDMHSESFMQWLFELEQGFNVCLHGWGSKRRLILDFAENLNTTRPSIPIIMFNGYAAGITLRNLLQTLASVIPSLKDQKLPANYVDAMKIVLAGLTNDDHASGSKVPKYIVLISSLDAAPLRRPPTQQLLAQLAHHPAVAVLASCDTVNFPLLWDASLRSQFNWAFHDATTFAPFSYEIGDPVGSEDMQAGTSGPGVVDEVNSLLGRSGRKVHGKEGVNFVLRSLTESARRLYGLLVAEILCLDVDGDMRDVDEDQDAHDAAFSKKGRVGQAMARGNNVSGIEYGALRRKAVQSLIATSEIQFRQLLKEFYDHEMLTSKKDGMGAEYLNLPFRREELEAILEELQLEM